jgi:hypothetical protein
MSGNEAAYMADYRAKNHAYVIRQRKIAKARRQAMEALAKLHQAEFQSLYRLAREKEGVS